MGKSLRLCAPPSSLVFSLSPVIALFLALAAGSGGVDFNAMLAVLSGHGDSMSRDIVLDLRLPRALNAFGCGALLTPWPAPCCRRSLRNPLADPFVLGISSGAGALSLIAMLSDAGGAGNRGGRIRQRVGIDRRLFCWHDARRTDAYPSLAGRCDLVGSLGC